MCIIIISNSHSGCYGTSLARQAFQKCDLYSKVDEVIDVDKLKGYYLKAIAKYFPKTLKW